MNHNFIISILDTDSLTISKPDSSEFKPDEINKLTEEINKISDELIRWEFEFYIPKIIVLRAKNYILYDGKKIKTKGSATTDQKREPAIREMVNKIIEAMCFDKEHTLVDIYKQYVKEAINVTDISRWAQKKSITEPVLKCRGYEKYTKEQLKAKEMRPNETNIWDAVKNEELVQQGDKVYIYPAILSTETVMEPVIRKNRKTGEMEHKGEKAKEVITYGLKMTKYWDKQDHDVEQLVKRVYDTIKIFSTVLDMDQFINYALVKNKELWKSL